MRGDRMERQAAALIGRCYAGLDAAGLREELLRRLRRMLPVDAAFFATVDPMTLLFTSASADEPLAAAMQLFLANEFGRVDRPIGPANHLPGPRKAGRRELCTVRRRWLRAYSRRSAQGAAIREPPLRARNLCTVLSRRKSTV